MYYDENGKLPLLRCVQEAERTYDEADAAGYAEELWERQPAIGCRPAEDIVEDRRR